MPHYLDKRKHILKPNVPLKRIVNKKTIQGVSKKSVMLKFRCFGTFNESIIKEISSAIINMTAIRHNAIILACVALLRDKIGVNGNS
jgi:hypothetical protein